MSSSAQLKRENMLAIILGLEAVGGRDDLFRDSLLAVDADARMDFETELVCTQLSVGHGELLRASFSSDAAGELLLFLLFVDGALSVHRCLDADGASMSLEVLHSLSGVKSYAHAQVALAPASLQIPLLLPVTILLCADATAAVLVGTVALEGVALTARTATHPAYASLIQISSGCRVSGVEELCTAGDDGCALSECFLVSAADGCSLPCRLLPVLHAHSQLAVDLAAALLEYLPPEAAVPGLALVHAMDDSAGDFLAVELMLAAFPCGAQSREWAYHLLRRSDTCLNAESLSRFQALIAAFSSACATLQCAASVFDAAACLCSEYLVSGAAEGLWESLAQALLVISALACFQDSSDSALIRLSLDHYAYFNRLLGFRADVALAPLPFPSCVSRFTTASSLPNIFEFMDCYLSNLLNPSLPNMLHASILQMFTNSNCKKSSFERLRHAVMFAQEVSAIAAAQNTGISASSIISKSFNSYLKKIAARESIPPQSSLVLLKAMRLPLVVKQLVVCSLEDCASENHSEWEPSLLQFMSRDEPQSSEYRVEPQFIPSGEDRAVETEDLDGFKEVEAISALGFPDDTRVSEACRLLCSSKPMYLRLPKAMEMDASDPLAFRHRQQMKLLSLSRRTLAVIVGRGMLTFGTSKPLLAETLSIPPICLKGRTPPNNAIVALDVTSAPAELTLWPEFHNGVACGLRLFPKRNSSDSSVVSRSWIVYNRYSAGVSKEGATASSHAGLLLGLGLNGHLRCLTSTDICDYLSPSHEPTTVAILLGVAASKHGAADPLISRTLCLHLPSLLAPSHWDFEVSTNIQAAALAGLGLLHRGTSNRLMTEFLLAELSRQPARDSSDTRESCSLAAGWALGMVLLSKGKGDTTAMKGVADLMLEDRLHQFIRGGEPVTESKLFPTVSSHSSTSNKSVKILESKITNPDVIGPGAVIALSLMYLGSSNLSVASRLAIPKTAFELDVVRPDLLLFRAMGWCLVMREEVLSGVASNEAWIESKIPEVVMRTLFGVRDQSLSRKFDAKSAFPVYLCSISGYCMGIGLVFAGTADLRARKALLINLKLLQSVRDMTNPAFVSLDTKSYKGTVDMCISVVAVALGSVMAGTGDVESMRIFRELRWKFEEGLYGYQMSLGMAIGLLFLAGGQASLKRDPFSIGVMVIAFAPKFPMRTVDNQYHLQPLRHLYALAVEWSADVDSNRSVPAHVDLLSNQLEGSLTSCLRPDLSKKHFLSKLMESTPSITNKVHNALLRRCYRSMRGSVISSILSDKLHNRVIEPGLTLSHSAAFLDCIALFIDNGSLPDNAEVRGDLAAFLLDHGVCARIRWSAPQVDLVKSLLRKLSLEALGHTLSMMSILSPT